MSKITLADLGNLQNESTAVNAINSNNAILEIASDNTLSRNGASPNEMESTLDMNSHRIINLPAADTSNQPVIKAQLDAISNGYLGNNILVGVNNEINVTSGAGTSTFGLPSNLTFTGKTINGGTFTNSTLSGTPNAITSKYIANGANIINATDYGIGTGVADNGPAINALIATLTHGGTIEFPIGTFNFSTPINMNSMSDIILRGKSGLNNGGPSASCLNFTGTGTGNAITMNSSVACALENLQITSSDAAYTGFLIKNSRIVSLNDPSLCRVSNCLLASNNQTCNGIDIDASETFSAHRTVFNGFVISIQGKVNSSSFQVGCYISECVFFNGASGGYIFNPGETWEIDNCIFERNLALEACGIKADLSNPFTSLTVTNSWFGDVEASGGEWIGVSGGVLIVEGCYFSSGSTSLTTNGIDLNTVDTVIIKGNKFENLSTAIGWSGTCVSCDIEPNQYLNCTNVYNGSPPGYGSKHFLPNGMLMQYGVVTAVTGTPFILTYPAALSSNPSSILLTLADPSGTNTVSAASATSTSCVINVYGTAGSNFVYYTIIGKSH